jgi:PAS domain S-box-containing protein
MITMAAWLKRQTVHRKLLLVIVTTCFASLTVAGAALFIFMTQAVRSNFVHDSQALAEIVAANSAASLAFKDKESAEEVLSALSAQEHIIGAAMLLPDQTTFASTGTKFSLPQHPVWENNGVWIDSHLYLQATPIKMSDELLGHLYLTTDFAEIHSKLLRSYVLTFAVVIAGAAALGFSFLAGAQRVISDPLRQLADAAKAASHPDSVRNIPAKPTSEIDDLTSAFIVMRERIEAGIKLEEEMTERRKVEEALRKSEEQFRSLFENAPVGLYRSSCDGRFTMANPALLRMLGYESFTEIENLDLHADLCTNTEYRNHFNECLERIGMVDETEVQWRRRDGRIIYVRESAKAIRNAQGEMLYCEGCVEDITTKKEAQAELQRLHRELVDASRAAGMAEVATGVLHNVGNVLNSVNVSATVLHEQLGRSKLTSLEQAIQLLQANLSALGPFLQDDPKGKLLPDFLIKVTQHLAAEHARWQDELRDMKKNIEHMKVIVSMQQSYAKVTGAIEPLSATELVEDALRMNEAALKRHGIRVECDFSNVPLVLADKHKVLQILVNLVRNAKHAMSDVKMNDPMLGLKVYKNGSGRIKIQVRDNGMGIPAENMTRIFSHGFTTRAKGHGFGLHSGALAARELGGTLEAESEGPGKGATFTLELPVAGGKC